MHHEHRGFDQTDPDASAALEDALPIVAELLTERAKPQPKDVDLLRAWRGYIAEIEERLALVADRAGCDVGELERLAAAQLGTRRSAPAPTCADLVPAEPPRKAPPTFSELNTELAELAGEVAELTRDQKRIDIAMREKITRMNVVRKLLFPHGRRRGL